MDYLVLKGAKENNLANLSIDIPHNNLVVVSGLSGSGKSTLAFDTIYAEGGRRYIETFSPYTRQFLDRLNPPKLQSIEHVRPALALEQRNRVTSSRSTVGTVTEINDYLKVIWSHFAELKCHSCQKKIQREPIEFVANELLSYAEKFRDATLLLGFRIDVTTDVSFDSLKSTLLAEGHIRCLLPNRTLAKLEEIEDYPKNTPVDVVIDRIKLNYNDLLDFISRLRASIAQCYSYGRGVTYAWILDKNLEFDCEKIYSDSFRCSSCQIDYPAPRPSLFSFNSPLGACDQCNGFGKVLTLDPELCILDRNKSIAGGVIHPWSTKASRHLLRKLLIFCEDANIPSDVPWKKLNKNQQKLVFDGSTEHAYKGVSAWFKRLERKRHKMHVRVLLARYRSEQECKKCCGSRLKVESLDYTINGFNIAQLWQMPIARVLENLNSLKDKNTLHSSVETALLEACSRLNYLGEIGLSYLTLDRQSRTLSGGESQRVSLTTLLGSRLVHTMLVLDEPTIGLHPKDTSKLIEILLKLRNRGNSLLVVEHDPDMILSADRLIELGPEAGSKGGEVIQSGSVSDLVSNQRSVTGKYFREGLNLARKSNPPKSPKFLKIKSARANNLDNLDIQIPLEHFVCITGASGSGKSTLTHECLYKPYEQLKRGLSPVEIKASNNIHIDKLEGLNHLDEIILIDQSPIGKTPRSNPATYTKAWDVIRELLAETPAATQLGLSKSAFSFNVDGGRCPACKGAGEIKVEMQFLADIYVTCQDCNGSRFQDSVLGVRFAGKNVVELLNTTIMDALSLFREQAETRSSTKIVNALNPLIALGLGYLKLGHPLNALSGGEAQRVKLASYLSEGNSEKCLFILDEPTTGLHPLNISDLITTFDQLLAQGHSVLCIEHNLDLIAQSDWLIDLGPGGGVEGGKLLYSGKPSKLAKEASKYPSSATAEYLAKHLDSDRVLDSDNSTVAFRPNSNLNSTICIRGAKENNLKNLNIEIPQGKIVAITGVSGSGKSTLAFDILFAEGQRRYINCLSPYARQFIKQLAEADVDQVLNLPPTIAISQKTAPSLGISTVATTTEVYQYLRLLFAKAGVQHCVVDDTPITSRNVESIVEQIANSYSNARVKLYAPVVSGRKGFYNDLFIRALNAGISTAKIDGSIVSLTPDLRLARHSLHYISLEVASLTVNKKNIALLRQAIEQCLILGNGVVELYQEDLYVEPEILSVDRVCPTCLRGYHELDPQDFSFRSARGVCTLCSGRGRIYESEESRHSEICPECCGARIAAIGRHVYFNAKTIFELCDLSAPELLSFIDNCDVSTHQRPIVEPIFKELRSILKTISEIGLDYLQLSRDSSSISGGEAQRLRLAKTIGSPLTGVCYVLDEPSIGLHPEDHSLLLKTLDKLRAQGNSVIVVEHDEDTIRAADHVIDVGPGGGSKGGQVVFEGSVEELEQCEESQTGKALVHRDSIELANTSIPKDSEWIELSGAKANNLKKVNVSIPCNYLTVVCGVSGSGKSSLIHQTLVPAIVELMEGVEEREKFYDKTWQELSGGESLERFLEIDQSPVGKTSSSTPISYLGVFDKIRKVFASLPEAKARGWGASHFSYNTGAGRCPHCEGRGSIVIPMSFLPDARTPCEYCNTFRYTEETLGIKFQGVSIGELLKLTFLEAHKLFENHRLIKRSIEYVIELGLDYLSLGQATHSVSGGEAQRLKIARELGARDATNTLYVLDEPTIGLHMCDVDRLRKVLQTLVDKGNTVIVIEHNLDLIRLADHLVELGPEAGERGGNVLFQGSPLELSKLKVATPTNLHLSTSSLRKNVKQ